MEIGVVGFLQNDRIVSYKVNVTNIKEKDYKLLFCVDPKIFKFSYMSNSVKFIVLTPLYVFLPQETFSVDFKNFTVNVELMKKDFEELRECVYTWLLCWKRMKIKEFINRDVALLIAKFILFRTRIGINLFG